MICSNKSKHLILKHIFLIFKFVNAKSFHHALFGIVLYSQTSVCYSVYFPAYTFMANVSVRINSKNSTLCVNVLVEDDQHIEKHSKLTNRRQGEKNVWEGTSEINDGDGISLIHF